MSEWQALFIDDDDDGFRSIVANLLSLDAPTRRGISSDEYVSIARSKWRMCEKDSVYAVRLLFDPLVQPQFQDESPTEMFCVLVARVGHRGELIDAPEGYEPPSYPDVRLSHIVAGSPSGGEEPDPSRPADYLLAYLDVLGFEALLRRVGLEQVNDRYVQLLEQALRPESEERPWAKSSSIVQNEIVPALMWLPIHTAYFSDSLLLWVHFRPGHVQEFLYRCSRVFCKALELGIPLRGAITIGPAIFHKERNIYIGEPLVEAARLESKLDWVGVALGASFKSSTRRVSIPPDAVLQYMPPLKSGGSELFSDLVLDWPRVWRELQSSSAIERLNELCAPELPESLKQRYRDACIFYFHSETNKDWFIQRRATVERA